MVKSKLFLLAPLGLLYACTSPMTRDQQLAIYHTRCLDYGYQPGTTEFAQCMEKQERQDVDRVLKERHLQELEKKNHLTKREQQLREKEAAMGKLKLNLW